MTTLELQKQLKKVADERDSLKREVQRLRAQADDEGASMWGGTYVLSEQIGSVQQELKELKQQHKAAQEAKDDALQELAMAKAAQTALEQALNTAKQEAREQAQDKEFYHASLSRAMADVETVNQELTTLKARLTETELLLGKAEALATSEGRGRKEAETNLAQRQQQLAQVRTELETRKSDHAATSRQLNTARDTVRKLEASQVSLQSRLTVSGEDLDRTRQQLQQLRETEGRVRVQWQESQAMVAQLQGTSQGQAEQLNLLTSELTTLREKYTTETQAYKETEYKLRQDLTIAQDQVAELTAELCQARQDVTAAEARLSELKRAEHDQRAGVGAAGPGVQHALAPGNAEGVDNSGGSGEAAAGANGHSEGDEGEREEVVGVPDGADDGEGGEGQGGAVPAVPVVGGNAGRGSVWDAEDDAEQLTILRTMVHDLKVKLAQATQEKVQALLAMAEIKQSAAAAAAAVSQTAPASTRIHGTHHGHHQSMPSSNIPGAGGGAGAGGAGLGTSPASHGVGFAALAARWSNWIPGAVGVGMGISGGGAGTGTGAGVLPSKADAASTAGGMSPEPLLDAGWEGPRHGPGTGMPAYRLQPAKVSSPRQGGDAVGGAKHAEVGRGAGTGNGGVEHAGGAGQEGLTGSGSVEVVTGMASTTQTSAAAVALQQAVKQLTVEAGEYLNGLQVAAHIILGSNHDPSLKWNALTGLSKLHMQLNHTRARLGLSKPHSLMEGRTSNTQVSKVFLKDKEQVESAQLTAQVLDLVDLGLECLEAYHRHEALSSVMTAA